MGLHTGTPHVAEEGYVGQDVHKGARIAAAGHGGQVLLSKETRRLAHVDVTDLGEHRLKDFEGRGTARVPARRPPPNLQVGRVIGVFDPYKIDGGRVRFPFDPWAEVPRSMSSPLVSTCKGPKIRNHISAPRPFL